MIPQSIVNFSWEFDTELDEQSKALEASQRFCAKQDGPWLTLCGASGRGKSHLARKVSKWRKAQPNLPGKVFWRWIDVLSIGRSPDRLELIHFMNRMDCKRTVIIDDFGAGHETAFSASLLSEIAERRIGKHTMFTTNLSISQIASEIDARIASRMRRDRSVVFTFEQTPDYDAQ